jgi:TatD DNase family protein
VIHAREADADIARILEEESAKGAFPFMLHCFTSGPELARHGLALGGYVSFSGVVTFKKSDVLRDIARDVPLDRILVETDAPYLAPEPMRGKTNEPAFVVHTATRLAAVKSVSEADLARATNDNFLRLFNKVPRASLKSPKSAA